jgi:hypothetical protein
MATTTNYGWTTPNDTDLVKDGAAAIRTLGSAIDTTVFNNASAGIPKTLIDAKGDLIAGTAADTAGRLAVGSNGNILVADSTTATGLAWAAPAGGGKLLQMVSATTNTQTVISTTTFTDTTLTATITPSSATSKIYVIYSQQYRFDYYAGGDQASGLKLLRGSTTIQSYGASNRLGAAGSQLQASLGGGSVRVVVGGNYLDSPATTSATTYKIQLAPYTTSNSGAIIAQEDTGSISVITLMEIGA